MRKKSLQIKNIITCIEMIHSNEFVSGVLSEEAIGRIKEKEFIDVMDYGISYPYHYLLTSRCVSAFPLYYEEWFMSDITDEFKA